MFWRNFFVLLLLCAAAWSQSTLAAPKSRRASKALVSRSVEDAQSRSRYPIDVTYQIIRSRAQSSLAGTVTENYQMTWTVLVVDQRITIESSYGTVAAHWEPNSINSKLGRVTLTRSDLVKLIGLEQELPQDAMLWQTDLPILIPVLDRGNRGLDQVLRHADDNGMLIVRLAARV